jgi:cholesterol transport system auxiliary component
MSDLRSTPRVLALAMLPLCVSGCVSGAFDSEVPERGLYVISAAAPGASDGAPLGVDLVVARPNARPGLDTDRIAVLNSGRRLDYYAGGRWGADADIVVQDLLVESLRNTGRLRSVQTDLSAFVAEYVLQSELNDFQAEYAAGGGKPIVRVTLVCTLGRLKDRHALAAYTATATAAAADNTLTAVVTAFESAYRQAAATAVDATLVALAGAGELPSAAKAGS